MAYLAEDAVGYTRGQHASDEDGDDRGRHDVRLGWGGSGDAATEGEGRLGSYRSYAAPAMTMTLCERLLESDEGL